jgi:hypothetical protein
VVIVTVHDAVLVPPEAVETAKEAILAEFGIIGLKPRLKVEPAHKQTRLHPSQQLERYTGT